MSSCFTFHIGRTEVMSGAGCAGRLPEILSQAGAEKALIVTDHVLSGISYFQSVIHTLENAGICYVLYDRVSPNPKDYEVMNGMEVYKKEACDIVIGIGGGSSMDCAKGIAAMVRHEGDIMDYGRSTPNRKFFTNGRERLVLVPTTSGTGSEVSPHAVITNTKIDRKSDVMESLFYADIVCMDPKFAMTMPAEVTAEVGVDALVHAIEAYTCKKMAYIFDPFHDAIALSAIELAARNLRKAYFCGDVDVQARERMMWSAMMAGFVLELDVGCIHGMAGMIQKYHHEVSHGKSVGVLLPAGMRFNRKAFPERFANIAKAFGVDTEGMSDIQAAEAAVAAVEELLHDIGFPKLSDYIKDPKEIDEFCEAAAANSCNKNNPRMIKPEDAKAIFLDAMVDRW